MKQLLKQLAITLLVTLPLASSPAQDLLGSWDLRGSYLKIEYSLEWKILKMTTPKTAYRPAVPIAAELYDDEFPNLNKTENVYRIQLGTIFDYNGPLPSRSSAFTEPAPVARENCSVSDSDLGRIVQKTEAVDFNDEKLTISMLPTKRTTMNWKTPSIIWIRNASSGQC